MTDLRRRPVRWLAVLFAFSLVIVACGSDDDDTDTAATTAAPTTAAPTTADDSGEDAETTEAPATTEEATTTTEAEIEPLKIRLVPWGGMFIDFIDLYVAEENGYFADAKIELEQLAGAGAGDAVFQVVGGNADIAMADPFSAFFATAQGADLEGFYCPYTKNWLTMVINNAAGINSPADLEGKTIAVTSQASTSKWYAQLLLAANGLTEDDVTMAATGVNFLAALEGGEAQAASTWGSVNWAMFGPGGLSNPDDYEILEYEQVPGPNDIYFANGDWLEENADGVGRFIDAIERAKAWIEENPDDAAEIGSRYAVGADNMDRNRAVIDFRIDMQNTGPGVDENGIGWCDVDTITDVAQQGVDLGILEGMPDVDGIISNRYHG